MNFLKSGFGRVSKPQRFDYEPRYAENKDREKSLEERIKFEKGALLKKSSTLSSRRGSIFSHKEKLSQSKKWKLLFYLLAMVSTIVYFYKYSNGIASTAFSLGLFLIFLILFIKTNNQR